MIKPEELSPAARAALVSLHARRGTTLHASVGYDARMELLDLRLVNTRWALTGVGALVRAECIEASLKAMEAGL